MYTTKPQLRSLSSKSDPLGVTSAAGLRTACTSSGCSEAANDPAELGWADPADDDAGANVGGSCAMPGPPNPHLLSTAIRSRSSGDKPLAFLTNLCFFRRSLRATRRASATSFWALSIAARAAAMLSSKSMRGFLARLAGRPVAPTSGASGPSVLTTSLLRSASGAGSGAAAIGAN